MTTPADGSWRPARTAPAELHALGAVLAAVGSEMIGGLGKGARQPLTFLAANQTEKAGIEALMPGGLALGDEAHVQDTNWIERFTADGWTIVNTLTGIAYAPDWSSTPINPGANPTSNFRYWIKERTVTILGSFAWTFGQGGVASSNVEIPLPIPAAMGGVNWGTLGRAWAQSAGFHWGGEVFGSDTGGDRTRAWVYFDGGQAAATIPAADLPFQSGFPGDFSPTQSGRAFSVNFSYTRA